MNKLVLLSLLLMLLSFPLGFAYAELTKTKVVAQPGPTYRPIIIPTPKDIDEQELWDLIQEWRKSSGLTEYIENPELCRVSSIRVLQIQDVFDHNTLVLKSLPYSVAENLIRDQAPAEISLQAWLNSPSHRENLEGDYKYSCLRCDKSYCVQIFSNLENGF